MNLEDFPDLDELDIKAKNSFSNKIVRKGYPERINELKRFPNYVSEFLINKYADNYGFLQEDALIEILSLINKYAPDKYDKESYKSILVEMGTIELIEQYFAYVDLRKGKYYTYISILDEQATVNRDLLAPSAYPDLLKSGVWGKAKIQYTGKGDGTSINVNGFEAYQSTGVILKSYIRQRPKFSTDEWINLLIRSIGINPNKLDRNMKFLYLTRIIPLVEPQVNSLELGPPGTGKSYIYENQSGYARMLLGGEITGAKLIYNKSTRKNGFVFTKDTLCFDEINKHHGKVNSLLAKMQQIMASNRVERGDLDAMTDVSLVFQGNIEFKNLNGKIVPKYQNFLQVLPPGMQDTAFLDRIHIFLHGWDFPIFSPDFLNNNLGLISNYFGKILHKLRRQEMTTVFSSKIKFFRTINGQRKSISSRDKNALDHIISGFLKLVYPDKMVIEIELSEIVDYAIQFRQNIINEMIKNDPNQKRTLGYELLPTQVIDDTSMENDDETERAITQLENDNKQVLKNNPQLNDNLFTNTLVEINSDHQLTHNIPYWLLKTLVNNDIIDEKEKNFIVKVGDLQNYDYCINEEHPILIEPFEKTTDVSFNDEENNIEPLIFELEALRCKVSDILEFQLNFNLNLIELQNLGKNEQIEQIEQIESIEEKICKFEGSTIKIKINELRKMVRNIEKEIIFISNSQSMTPDILKPEYVQIICSNNEKINKLEKQKKFWHETLKQLRSNFNPILKEIIEIKQKIPIPDDSKNPQLFNGQKFPMFAFDVNNIVISTNKLMKKKNGKVLRGFSPLRKIKSEFLENPPYRAYFFASSHLKIQEKYIPSNQYVKWYIEKYKKGKVDADVDSLLTGQIGVELNKYKDQISEFYLGSGDKDLHIVVDIAKDYNIPVNIIVASNENLSRELEELANEVYTLY
jgi:ATP-dependent Lon protease